MNKRGGTQCEDCQVGHIHTASRTSCQPCSPGTFSDEIRSIKCLDCKAGEHQPGKGQDLCLKCLAGSYSMLRAKECIKCKAGFFQDLQRQSSCKPCSSGSYAPERGTNQCLQCPRNMYQDKVGQSQCIRCPEGKMTVEGSVSCFGCPAGQHIGRIDFHGLGIAGASSAFRSQTNESIFGEKVILDHSADCPFLAENCPRRKYRYWKSRESVTAGSQYLWFKFKIPRVIVAFSFVGVEEFVPVNGLGFRFYGSNSTSCLSHRTTLYEPEQRNQFFVKIESNTKAFLCYGFEFIVDGSVHFAALRPPIQVCKSGANI